MTVDLPKPLDLVPEDRREDLVAAVGEAVRERLPRSRLRATGLDPGDMRRSLEASVAAAFEIDTLGTIASALAKWDQLAAKARESVGADAKAVVVPLYEQTVRTRHHPTLTLLLNEAEVCTLVFDMALDLHLSGLHATLRKGRLVALAAGTLTLEIGIGLEGQRLWSYRAPPVDMPAAIDLGEGISIPPTAGPNSDRNASVRC